MGRIRITQDFTFRPEGRGAIALTAGDLFFVGDELAEEWTRRGKAQDEAAPWPPMQERRPPILGPDGRIWNQEGTR